MDPIFIHIIKSQTPGNPETFNLKAVCRTILINFEPYSHQKVLRIKEWLLSLSLVFFHWSNGDYNHISFVSWLSVGQNYRDLPICVRLMERATDVANDPSFVNCDDFATEVEMVYCILELLTEKDFQFGFHLEQRFVQETVCQRAKELLRQEGIE